MIPVAPTGDFDTILVSVPSFQSPHPIPVTAATGVCPETPFSQSVSIRAATMSSCHVVLNYRWLLIASHAVLSILVFL